ncbi:MAG TPA: class I SAM-dependent methyltransferase [Dehalococcoidia bacterium]|nr:class I SAM-dependent methyltransferase [Dehalococcoidia bacterium]
MENEVARAMDVVARYYDLDLDGFDDDILLYEGFAERTEGEVLELGCGTGRISAALARAGKTVTAVDLSGEMLRRAEARAAGFETVQADLLDLDLGHQFGLVIAPLGTLHHIASDQRPAAFAAIRRHLAHGGLFVADLAVESDWSPGLQPLICHWTRDEPATGNSISKFVAIESDPTSLSQRVTYFFDETEASGALRRSVAVFDLGYFTEHEVRFQLQQNCMRVESFYGDYDLGTLEPESERMIVVARAG